MADSVDSDRVRRDPPSMISVVIPARNAAALLPAQLAALEGQDFDRDWELIVVDNGSTDNTTDIARSWSDRLPMQVISALDRPGVSYARNTGVLAARGDLIVFCDADDEVSESWLTNIVEASLTADAVGGATSLTQLNDPVAMSWNSLTLTSEPRLAGGFLPTVSTCNLSVWMDVFESLSGFNEQYGYGVEDIEFTWRLQLAGYRLSFAPEALIHYRTRADLQSLARQFFLYGRGGPRLYRDFRSVGMPRTSIYGTFKSWAWLVLHLPDLARGRSRRGIWVRGAAMRMGRVAGSIENRVFYL